MADLYRCLGQKGSVAEVQRLLDIGENVNYINKESGEFNSSVLHQYCWSYYTEPEAESFKILQLLIDKGALIDAVDKLDQTPLMLLVDRGFSLEHLNLLLRKGANVKDVKNTVGLSVLHFVVFMDEKKIGEYSLSLLKLLIDNGAVIDSADRYDQTPLMYLTWKGFPLDHLTLLVSNGANLKDKTNEYGLSVLHFVAIMDEKKIGGYSLSVLQLLIENGAVIDAMDIDNETPLMFFVERGMPLDHIKILLNNGANINHKNTSGNTVLHKFVKGYRLIDKNSFEILELLVTRGCNVKAVNNNGDSPLQLFLQNKYPTEYLDLIRD